MQLSPPPPPHPQSKYPCGWNSGNVRQLSKLLPSLLSRPLFLPALLLFSPPLTFSSHSSTLPAPRLSPTSFLFLLTSPPHTHTPRAGLPSPPCAFPPKIHFLPACLFSRLPLLSPVCQKWKIKKIKKMPVLTSNPSLSTVLPRVFLIKKKSVSDASVSVCAATQRGLQYALNRANSWTRTRR